MQVPANRASKRPRTESSTDKTPDETMTDGEMEDDDQGAGQGGSEQCDDRERDKRNAVGKQAQVFSNGAGGSGSSGMQRSSMQDRLASRIDGREREIEDHHHVSLYPSSQQPSPASSTGPAKHVPASRHEPAVASISTLAKESADSRGDEFGSQHLALVLRAAFPSKVAMTKLVQEVKAKNETFKAVQLSSQAIGGKYSPEQIAVKIAECRPEQVASAAQLLSWLTVRYTSKAVRIRS